MATKTKQQFISTELDLDPYRQAITGRLASLGKERYDRILAIVRGNEQIAELAVLQLLAEKKIALVITGNIRRQNKWLCLPEQVAELPDILAIVGAQSDVELSSFEKQRQAEQAKLQAMDAAQNERLQAYSAKQSALFEQRESQALDVIGQKWRMVETDSYERLRYQLQKRAESERVITQLRHKRDLAIQRRDFYRNEYHRLLNREAPAWLLDDYCPLPEGLSNAIEELQK